jgi:hypothetical protein
VVRFDAYPLVMAGLLLKDGYGGSPAWPTFSALHCRQTSAYGTTAVVLCTFNDSGGLAGLQQDNFWTVDLQRQPDGRWLITNYGQG